jgi:hypothetical protein
MSENDVIRKLLGLKSSSTSHHTPTPQPSELAWVSKGVSFPAGTKFRATYKGQQHTGTVEDGALVVNGERYTSPSAAAITITGSSANGWRFWECLLPGKSQWKLIANLRK